MNTGFIVNRDNSLFRKVFRSLPDSGIIILRACGDFHKGEIAGLLIGVRSDDALEYMIGDDRLRDIITQVEVLFRSI